MHESDDMQECNQCKKEMIVISGIVTTYDYLFGGELDFQEANIFQCPQCKSILVK